MKIKFDLEKFIAVLRQNVRVIVIILFLVGVAILSYGTYLVLAPTEDASVVRTEKDEITKLDISFDKKALEDLKNKKSPSVINDAGGRNPFMPF